MSKREIDIKANEVHEIDWMTFEGQIHKLSEIDHQHLTNIYYWTHYLHPEWYADTVKYRIKITIDQRFDGELLDYKPLRRFKDEMKLLELRGWLCEDDEYFRTNVIINGKMVGYVDETR